MDAAQEHRTHVVEVVRRGGHAVSARFERPAGFSYLAGQWAFVTIEQGGEALTRHLTLSSSPTEPFLEMTKGMTGHPFAEAFAALAPGDEVVIRGPRGRFTLQDGDEDVVFISGGIGVTPLRSMARYVTDTNLLVRILLLYSARTEEDVLFREEFEEMQRKSPRLGVRVTLTRPGPGYSGPTGRIDRAFVEQAVPDVRGRGFYVSGPGAMVDEMAALLGEMGVPDGQVRREVFTGY
jgi:glycine betaine catabolism B